ncbi:purine nucleoside permease [Meredithblackwellia eburnea MCA 4105]
MDVSVERRATGPIAPRVMIITMFAPERAVWIKPLELTVNVTVPGLSPLFPVIACNTREIICCMTTGESEINAAASTMAMFLSPKFDFKLTYFLVAGIAGVNPYYGTLGTAMFARFAVQVGLQYELDARQMPANWTTGYWGYGTSGPGLRPTEFYGTEIFEVSTPLLARVMDLTKNLTLNDSSQAIAYRSKFDYAPANLPPTVTQCDVATSDVYYAGTLLSEGFGNFTKLLSNGTANYCSTAQEDNATLESLVRADKAGLADYSRIIILRTGSDFDRAPPPSANLTAYEAFEAEQGGFAPAIANLFIAGWPVVKEIAYDWDAWKDGTPTQSTKAPSFYGDVFGTLNT